MEGSVTVDASGLLDWRRVCRAIVHMLTLKQFRAACHSVHREPAEVLRECERHDPDCG
jgi:hypothetical protein